MFNGNGYDPSWPAKADELGLFHIDSGVDAIKCFVAEKNTALFESHSVFKPNECEARKTILLELYQGVVEMEAQCMARRPHTTLRSLLSTPPESCGGTGSDARLSFRWT